MDDLISRQAAIDALKNDMASLDHIIKGMSANDVRLDAYVSQRNQVDYDIYAIKQLPPAQPAPSQVAADIARIVENGKDMRVIEAAQPTPDQNGDLWITVPDIDKVTCIYVQESKSKFCRIFYEEQQQPERIIHCKDCEWWTKQECSPQGRCALYGMYPTGGWFCGNAKRREVTA